MRLSENSLLRIGVVHPEHRQEILRKISQQRIKSNMLLLRDMERRQQTEEQGTIGRLEEEVEDLPRSVFPRLA